MKISRDIDGYVVIRCDGLDGARGYILGKRFDFNLKFWTRTDWSESLADAHSFRSAESVVAQIQLLKGAGQ